VILYELAVSVLNFAASRLTASLVPPASCLFCRWRRLKSGLQASSFPLVAWAGRLLSLRAVDYHVSLATALLCCMRQKVAQTKARPSFCL
jgi:hypothetical protein